MRRRENGFFFSLGFGDVVRILFALAFSLAGYYLIFRMLFGPPMFGPAFQSQIKALERPSSGAAGAAARAQPRPPTGPQQTPGEVSVGIAPGK